jgi:hypothetical protein
MIGCSNPSRLCEGLEQKASLEWIVERGKLGSTFSPFARARRMLHPIIVAGQEILVAISDAEH